MKVLYCTKCGDIRSFDVIPVDCRCGNMTVRWVDPHAGTVKVSAEIKQFARIIGIHNGMLRSATDSSLKSHADWAKRQKDILADAEGYIFHEKLRNSWACIVRPGETNDISWEDGKGPFNKVISNSIGYRAHLREDIFATTSFVSYVGDVYNPDGGLISTVSERTHEALECAAIAAFNIAMDARPDQ